MKVKINKVNIIEELAMIEYTKKNNSSEKNQTNSQTTPQESDWFKILNWEDNSSADKEV